MRSGSFRVSVARGRIADRRRADHDCAMAFHDAAALRLTIAIADIEPPIRRRLTTRQRLPEDGSGPHGDFELIAGWGFGSHTEHKTMRKRAGCAFESRCSTAKRGRRRSAAC